MIDEQRVRQFARRLRWLRLKRRLRPSTRTIVNGFERNAVHARPVAAAELDAIEQRFGGRLPDDYRLYLTRVGAGHGPMYGLLDAAGVVEETLELASFDGCCPHEPPRGQMRRSKRRRLNVEYRRDFAARVWSFAALKPRHLDPLSWRSITGEFGEQVRYVPVHSQRGCVVILHHGCQFYTAIVTVGAVAGTLWDVTLGSGMALPKLHDDGRPMTFLDFMQAWYDEVR